MRIDWKKVALKNSLELVKRNYSYRSIKIYVDTTFSKVSKDDKNDIMDEVSQFIEYRKIHNLETLSY